MRRRARPADALYQRCIFLLLDGARPDVFHELLAAGAWKLLAKGYVSLAHEPRHLSALEEAAGEAARRIATT